MKTASTKLNNLLKNSTAIKALPEVVAEWNLNRYHDTRVGNVPDDDETSYDAELFPIESIVLPNRPLKGINKARVGHSVVSPGYLETAVVRDARFYIADEDDQYNYWTSPLPAVNGVVPVFNATNFPTADYPDLGTRDNQTSARPFVEYGKWTRTVDPDTGYTEEKNFTASTVRANKVVIKFENTWATPATFNILITRSGTTANIPHTAIASGWQGTGEIVLYWNGTSWGTHAGPVYDSATGFPLTDNITKVQVAVHTLTGGYFKTEPGQPLVPMRYRSGGTWKQTDGKDSFVDIIEISARLEADLSRWVIEVNDTFDFSEVSNLYPIGTLTSNQGDLTLSNIYQLASGEWAVGVFSRDNTDSRIPWLKYLEKNVEIRLKYAFYDNEDSATPFERVQQFVMYTEGWGGQDTEEVNVEIADFSKFFNEITLAPAMWEGLSAPEIVWRILDSVGFNNFHIDRGDLATEHTIPVFYTNGEESVWEVLDQLAQATQSAIYFDGFGVLQVKTRDYAFSPDEVAQWTLQSQDDGTQKANIVTADQAQEFEPNSIKVIYQKTNWSAFNNGMPALQNVWEPESSSVVLRAAPLIKSMARTDKFFWLSAADAKVWPYEGLINIQGEIIRYNGKQMVYYTGPNGGQRRTAIVGSEDERQAIQKKATVGHTHRSHWSGAFRVAQDEDGMAERGVWNSEAKGHSVDLNGYGVRNLTDGGKHSTKAAGLKHIKKESRAELVTGPKFKNYNDMLLATRGAPDDQAFFYYGTKMQFVREQGRSTQAGGIVIHNSGNRNNGEDGYYIELMPSARLTAKDRAKRQELVVYSRINGKQKILATRPAAIGGGIEYELDVAFINPSGTNTHILQVWINGKGYIDVTVSGADRVTPGGRFGMFVRGKTRARFEYLYAIRRPEPPKPNDFSFLDRVARGYTGNQWDREWVFQWQQYRRKTKKKSKKAQRRKNRQFFDEFGPIVHEIREFDVKFDPTPVLHSRPYITNDWSATCLQYNASPFGAQFIIANTSRKNAVLHGDDTISFAGTGDSVSQALTVLGRGLIVDEAEQMMAENVEQIRARGRVEAELTSPWIQSKTMARDLADWMRKNFSYGNEGLSVEIFGNPLIEVGDVVRMQYPERHIIGDYFVTGVSNSFSGGLTTTLTLRRRI